MFRPMAAPPRARRAGSRSRCRFTGNAPAAVAPPSPAPTRSSPPRAGGAARAFDGLAHGHACSCVLYLARRAGVRAPCAAGEALQWPTVLCSQTKRARPRFTGRNAKLHGAARHEICTASACRGPRCDQWPRLSRGAQQVLHICFVSRRPPRVSSSQCQRPRDLVAQTVRVEPAKPLRFCAPASRPFFVAEPQSAAARTDNATFGCPAHGRPAAAIRRRAMDREEAADRKARLAPPPTKQGWLHKKGGAALSAERKRWFVLQGAGSEATLRYSKEVNGGHRGRDTVRGHPRGRARRQY